MAKSHKLCGMCCCDGCTGFAIFLILIGLFLLGQDMEFIPETFSVWPIVLIGLGIYLFASRRHSER